MLSEVVDFIADKAGLTVDTDIFDGHRPQGTTDNCDVVLETVGGAVYFKASSRVDPVFQVISRGKTYVTARKRAWAIFDAIYTDWPYGSAGWTIGPVAPSITTYKVMVIVPLASPQYIGQDKKLRFEFSTNYIFRIRKL